MHPTSPKKKKKKKKNSKALLPLPYLISSHPIPKRKKNGPLGWMLPHLIGWELFLFLVVCGHLIWPMVMVGPSVMGKQYNACVFYIYIYIFCTYVWWSTGLTKVFNFFKRIGGGGGGFFVGKIFFAPKKLCDMIHHNLVVKNSHSSFDILFSLPPPQMCCTSPQVTLSPIHNPQN